MNSYVIIRISFNGGDYIFGGYYRDGVLDRMNLSNDPDPSDVGNIYAGKITEVKKNIGGAFADIGHTKVFLPEKGHRCGEELPVQVTGDARGRKLPRASSRLSAAGRYCIVKIPGTGRVTYSRRIKTEGWKGEDFAGYIDRKLIQNADITVRTNAIYNREGLEAEIPKLLLHLTEILKKSETAACHSLLYKADPEYIRELISLPEEGRTKIVTDDNTIFGDLVRRGYDPEMYDDPGYPLKALYNIGRDLERLAGSKVYLKCGGYIVIEKTEAFYTIDVNSGKCIQGSSPEETYFRINREAALESARQIRLRNLTGIILIDFINMKNEEYCNELMRITAKALSYDSNKGIAVDITKLGIMEITRASRGMSFAEKTGNIPQE